MLQPQTIRQKVIAFSAVFPPPSILKSPSSPRHTLLPLLQTVKGVSVTKADLLWILQLLSLVVIST